MIAFLGRFAPGSDLNKNVGIMSGLHKQGNNPGKSGRQASWWLAAVAASIVCYPGGYRLQRWRPFGPEAAGVSLTSRPNLFFVQDIEFVVVMVTKGELSQRKILY